MTVVIPPELTTEEKFTKDWADLLDQYKTELEDRRNALCSYFKKLRIKEWKRRVESGDVGEGCDHCIVIFDDEMSSRYYSRRVEINIDCTELHDKRVDVLQEKYGVDTSLGWMMNEQTR